MSSFHINNRYYIADFNSQSKKTLKFHNQYFVQKQRLSYQDKKKDRSTHLFSTADLNLKLLSKMT